MQEIYLESTIAVHCNLRCKLSSLAYNIQKMKNKQVFQKPYNCSDQLVNDLCILPSKEFCFNECGQKVVSSDKRQYLIFFLEPWRLEKEVKQEMERLQLASEKHNAIAQYLLSGDEKVKK